MIRVYCYILLQLIFVTAVTGQQKNDCVIGEMEDVKRQINQILRESEPRNQYIHKKVLINFHFLLRTNGQGNFNEMDDGLPTHSKVRDGYQISFDLLNRMNNDLSWNEPTLCSSSTFPNLPVVESKKYNYVLDAIYFHRDDNVYYMNTMASSGSFNQYGQNTTSVINIFFSEDSTDGTVRGRAYNSIHNTNNKYTDVGNVWDRYQLYLIDDEYNSFLHASAYTIMHELGHLKGLLHTVYIGGTSTICPQTAPNCDDGIPDTPTAYEIFHHPNCGVHPAGAWANCSNDCYTRNFMDYQGGNALTPQQIQIIHFGLENGMRTYNLCHAVGSNTSINTLGFPQISYYGKEIDVISTADGGSVLLEGEEPADLYFSSDVEFFPLEVKGNSNYKTKMEVFQYNTCSF